VLIFWFVRTGSLQLMTMVARGAVLGVVALASLGFGVYPARLGKLAKLLISLLVLGVTAVNATVVLFEALSYRCMTYAFRERHPRSCSAAYDDQRALHPISMALVMLALVASTVAVQRTVRFAKEDASNDQEHGEDPEEIGSQKLHRFVVLRRSIVGSLAGSVAAILYHLQPWANSWYYSEIWGAYDEFVIADLVLLSAIIRYTYPGRFCRGFCCCRRARTKQEENLGGDVELGVTANPIVVPSAEEDAAKFAVYHDDDDDDDAASSPFPPRQKVPILPTETTPTSSFFAAKKIDDDDAGAPPSGVPDLDDDDDEEEKQEQNNITPPDSPGEQHDSPTATTSPEEEEVGEEGDSAAATHAPLITDDQEIEQQYEGPSSPASDASTIVVE